VEIVYAFIPIVAIVGGLGIAALAVHHKYKMRELQHRERLAMIERGLTPPPELDPERFEQMLSLPAGSRSAKHRSAGVILIGLGLALMLIIGFTSDEPREAFGVGGAVMALGAAFVANSILTARDQRMSAPPPIDAPKRIATPPPAG
jgi:hypothetical protein